jgi:hypothetical protein
LVCQLIAWLAVEVGAGTPTRSISLPESVRSCLAHDAAANLPEPDVVGPLARDLITHVDRETAALCWRLTPRDFAELLAQLQCAMTGLLHLEALHTRELEARDFPHATHRFQTAIRTALTDTDFSQWLSDYEFNPHRDAYMLDIVGNTVCADLLDYARRDSHFAGLRLDHDADRIAENFTLVSWETPNRKPPAGRGDPFQGSCLRAAISLVSHKYRTDVPSELMHLLNVRFYLYERVIYHPTKCSAGAMLGTALQLLGWRTHESDRSKPLLPTHLRFVGDDVFLHDIRAAVGFLVSWLHGRNPDALLRQQDLDAVSHLDRVHNGLVPALLALRLGNVVGIAQQELAAAKLLLDRLTSRRFFRPIFRVLPSSTDPRAGASESAQPDLLAATGLVDPQKLANLFRNPDIRYGAEREIERRSKLPTGSITIHCPRSQTAEKIAAVLLTRPEGGNRISQLRDIATLDPKVFSKHQEAVLAVEAMYQSMWRLVVYVAPEYLPDFETISRVAGRVILEVAAGGALASAPDLGWENDPQLAKELKAKLGTTRGIPDSDSLDLTPTAQAIGQLTDEMLDADQIPGLPLITGPIEDLPVETTERIRRGLQHLWDGAAVSGQGRRPATLKRSDWLIHFIRPHARPTGQQASGTKRTYDAYLDRLSSSDFEDMLAGLEHKINVTASLQQRSEGPRPQQSGYNLNELLDHVDDFLRSHGVEPPSKRDPDIYRQRRRGR